MIKVAVAGAGNCACSLVQWISEVQNKGTFNEKRISIANNPLDIAPVEFVAAFDIDSRKVGLPLSRAILSEPNCTPIFTDNPVILEVDPVVNMGKVLDGASAIVRNRQYDKYLEVASFEPVVVRDVLCAAQADVLVILLPVGSKQAVEFYAREALSAGCAVVNGVPVLLGNDKQLMSDFFKQSLPYVGDDTKSQFGATYLHQIIVAGLEARGCKITEMHQLNFGGNTDFLNMRELDRLEEKRISKTQAVMSRIAPEKHDKINVHIGPSDYIPHFDDKKQAIIKVSALGAGNQPIEIRCDLEVIDSPNAAGSLFEAIQAVHTAKKKGIGGPLNAINEELMKSPATM